MSTLDGYSRDEIEVGVADLSYHLANPRLDPIIWRLTVPTNDLRSVCNA